MNDLAPTPWNSERTRAIGKAAALWGVAGVVALFTSAVTRLTPYALEAIANGLSTWQWVTLVVWTAANAYAEGYRAFQTRFAPRVVARALHLSQYPRWHHVLLAPAFCLALFHATRRRQVVAWSTIALIALLVTIVRATPQPWRGIIDAGVVVPLAWGAVAIVVIFLRAMSGIAPGVPSEVPG